MTQDLDPRDLDEVRRRVVMPVVRSLIRGNELEDVVVGFYRDDSPDIEYRDAIEIVVTACGESLRPSRVWYFDNGLWDAQWLADDLFDLLQNEVVESRFGWGDLRRADYEVLPPL